MMHVGTHSVEISALRHAVPYLALFRGRTFVVKLGGGALADPRAVASMVEQVATLHHLGVRVVLVHGGGPQATSLARDLGIEVRQVAGRRVTDDATLTVVTMTLCGEANTRLLAACRAAGLPAAGVSGVDGGLIVARRRPPVAVEGESQPVDYGHVGDVESVDPALLAHLLDGGYVPVVSPLAADADGEAVEPERRRGGRGAGRRPRRGEAAWCWWTRRGCWPTPPTRRAWSRTSIWPASTGWPPRGGWWAGCCPRCARSTTRSPAACRART